MDKKGKLRFWRKEKEVEVEDHLEKDFPHVIDWVAAEFKYVHELKEEINRINKEENLDDKTRDLKKALSILRHIGRSERRAYQLEQRVGTNLDRLIEIVESKMKKNHSSVITQKIKLIKHFREVVAGLDVSEYSILRFASMYEGVLKGELDDAKRKLLLEKAIKNDKKSGEGDKGKNLTPDEIHSELEQLLAKILADVGKLEKWVSALEAGLKDAKDTLENLKGLEKKGLWDAVIPYLEEYGFPVDKYPTQTFFLLIMRLMFIN